MTDLSLSDIELKSEQLSNFKNIENPYNLHYAFIVDGVPTNYWYRFFFEKKDLLSFIDSHIEANRDQSFVSHNYSIALVSQDIVDLLSQPIDRDEPDSYYKSIIESEGVLIAENKSIRDYIIENQDLINPPPFQWPSYNPSDPEWRGAADELKFEAERLGYELKWDDLQNLEYLSKHLLSLDAGRQLGDMYVEVMDDLKNGHIELNEDTNLKKKSDMENNTPTNQDRYSTQKVGNAIKFQPENGEPYFRVIVEKDKFAHCSEYSYDSKSTNEKVVIYNLSLKALKSPLESGATHILVDSLHFKSNIDDKFAEENIQIRKKDVLAKIPNAKGELSITIAGFDKTKVQQFDKIDWKVYITQPKGEKVPPDAYIGYGTHIDYSKAKPMTNDSRINRDFLGSAFIDHNEKLPHGQVLNVSLDKVKLLSGVESDTKPIFVNFIQVKNNPEQLAVYISENKNDISAQFTFRLEVPKVKALTQDKEGYVRISGYFDDNHENKNYNIKVVEQLSRLDREQGKKAMEVGLGADKQHIAQWQQPRVKADNKISQENDTPFKQASVDTSTVKKVQRKENKIPSSDVIKGGVNERGKGLKNEI